MVGGTTDDSATDPPEGTLQWSSSFVDKHCFTVERPLVGSLERHAQPGP